MSVSRVRVVPVDGCEDSRSDRYFRERSVSVLDNCEKLRGAAELLLKSILQPKKALAIQIDEHKLTGIGLHESPGNPIPPAAPVKHNIFTRGRQLWSERRDGGIRSVVVSCLRFWDQLK